MIWTCVVPDDQYSAVSLASLVPHPIFSDGNVNLKHNFFPQMKMGPFEHRVGEEE